MSPRPVRSLSTIVLLAAAGLLLGACQKQDDTPGVPYTISADTQAEYSVDCRFPAYKILGSLVNTIQFQGKGPKTGKLATEHPRCVLKKLTGPGPVTLTITSGKKTFSGTVTASGEETKVLVF
jgi:hypothetical protein